MNWSAFPNIIAIALLTCAFASVLRRNQTPGLNIWLMGWIFVLFHFAAMLLAGTPEPWGSITRAAADVLLLTAALVFQRSAVSYRDTPTSRLMFFLLAGLGSAYLLLFDLGLAQQPYLDLCALLLALAPLANFIAHPEVQHLALRRYIVGFNFVLGIALIGLHHQHWLALDLGRILLLFTVYSGVALHFWYAFRRATAGSIITILSFLMWGLSFPLSYWYAHSTPLFHVDMEIWNMPKYVVGFGMMLLMLENQMQHSLYLALHDDLTGLPNRRLFQDRLEMALARVQRNRGQLALLQIDLNNFKMVNDNYGHHAGDEVLRRVSTAFLSRLRRSDTLARTGGDEFSLILEDQEQAAAAEHVAASLHQLLKTPVRYGNHDLYIKASIGIAFYPQDADNSDDLCITADHRMYVAKNESRAVTEELRTGLQR